MTDDSKVNSTLQSYKASIIDIQSKKALKGIIIGIVSTLILLTVIPFIFDTFVSGLLETALGGVSTLFFSSRILVDLVMWIAIVKTEDLVDSEKLMDGYGIFGIIGLIIAYALMGDVTDAIIPILTIIPAKFGLVS